MSAWRVVAALAWVSALVLLCVVVSILADLASSQKALVARADEQLAATRGLGHKVKPFLTVTTTKQR
jgi:hypothetical protein